MIATGARSFIPAIHGIDEVPYHTSDTIMHLAHQPEHLLVVGGGFIAAELGHVFGSLGSKVTDHQPWPPPAAALRTTTSPARYTEIAAAPVRPRPRHDVQQVYMTAQWNRPARRERRRATHRIEGDTLLVAAGRLPNGDELDAHARRDRARPDRQPCSSTTTGEPPAPGVWALGDVNGRYQLKHMANGEAKMVQHNLLHPDDLRPLDRRPAPHAVFGSPQIGAIGLTEAQAEQLQRPITVVVQPTAMPPTGGRWRTRQGFCKLIGDPATRLLLGAHVIGYQASLLAQQLVQGMHLGNTVDELADGQVWIHPALAEVVEQALLSLIRAFA